LPKVSLYLSVKREDVEGLRMLGLALGFIMREEGDKEKIR
jgi:hypothetical protein